MRKDRSGGIGLGGTDQEDEPAKRSEQALSKGKDGFEAFDGAKGDDIVGCGGEGFGAGVQYIDVRQYKGAGDFAEEGYLLLIGLDERDRYVRRPELDRGARESGPGAEIGDGYTVVDYWSLVVRLRG